MNEFQICDDKYLYDKIVGEHATIISVFHADSMRLVGSMFDDAGALSVWDAPDNYRHNLDNVATMPDDTDHCRVAWIIGYCRG